MGWFRKKEPEVIRRGSSDVTEERKSVRVGGQTVDIRRVTEVGRPPDKARDRSRSARPNRGATESRARSDRGAQPSRGGRERHVEDEIIIPTDVGRKQMLVRVLPHQTQVVVLEGPVLVEHYVAGQDRASAVGNIYLGKVRNVLPGMEAAFIDFGSTLR